MAWGIHTPIGTEFIVEDFENDGRSRGLPFGNRWITHGGWLSVMQCLSHLQVPKGRKIEAIFFDCLIGLVVWVLAFAISAEVAMKQDDSDLFERVFSFATPFLMFLLSIYFSRKRW